MEHGWLSDEAKRPLASSLEGEFHLGTLVIENWSHAGIGQVAQTRAIVRNETRLRAPHRG
jgi:hypothetical protein